MKLFTAFTTMAMLLLGTAYRVFALDADTFVSDLNAFTHAAGVLDKIVQQVTQQNIVLQIFMVAGDIQDLRSAAGRVMQDLRQPGLEPFPQDALPKAAQAVITSMNSADDLLEDLIEKHDVITTFPPAIDDIFHALSKMQADLEDAVPIVEYLFQSNITDGFEPSFDTLQYDLEQAVDLYNPSSD